MQAKCGAQIRESGRTGGLARHIFTFCRPVGTQYPALVHSAPYAADELRLKQLP